MIYRCVICMVATSQRSLMMLNGERRRLWETIISPRVNILELEKSTVGTCSACFKLLNSMISFQQTMVAGANHIINLQAQVKSKHYPIIFRKANSKLPPPKFSQSVADLVLPVVNEELVYSSESWQDVQFVVPANVTPAVKTRTLGLSGTVFHNIEPSAPVTVNLSDTVVHGAVRIADCNDDYAVLVPVKENSINLLCEEEVLYSSESGKVEKAPPLPDCAKKYVKAWPVNVTETSEVRKQKLNRRLYEALRATIRSPNIAKKFYNNYEPESNSELGHEPKHVKKNQWQHRSLYESENKLKDESCNNPNVHMHKLSHETYEADESTNVFVHELRLDSGRMPRDKSGHIWKDKLIHEIKHELGNISSRDLEHDLSHVSRHKLKDVSCHNSNESVHKLSPETHKSAQDFGHELTHNSERSCRDDSGHIWRDKLIHDIKYELGHISRHELENESNHVPGFKLKDGSCHNSNESVHKSSHESHKSTQDFGLELTHNSRRISRDDTGRIWRDKLIDEIKHELGHIPIHVLENDSNHVPGSKLKDGSCHNSNESVHKLSHESQKLTDDLGHKLTHNSGRISRDDLGHIWRDKLIHEIKHELGHISRHELENEFNHVPGLKLRDGSCHNSNESVHKLSHESHKSTQDFKPELTHNSGRISTDNLGHIWRDKLIQEIKHELGPISCRELEHESSHVSRHKLKNGTCHKSNEAEHKLSHESHKSTQDFGHELTHNSARTSRDESGHIWRDKLIHDIKHELGNISRHEWEHESNPSGHKLKDESRHEWSNDSTHQPAHESRHIPEHESRHVSGHELMDESGHKSKHVSGYELKDDSGHKLKDESGHESAYDSGHDMGCESTNDHDSSSTLSCDSDYENPELYPNIIFAQSFNKVSEDVQMHSHIVTNPPSEWPCSWERCQLQDSSSDEEVEPAPNSGEVQNGGIREDSPETVFQCDVCREACAGEAELKLHKIKHRLRSAAAAEHPCAACGVAFRSGRGLLRHRDTPKHAARSLWRFQCDICKRKCPDKKQMGEHIERMHLAKDRMKCPMCSAVLPSARSLGRHAATHILTPTEKNTRTQTKETRKKRNIHEIRTETHANGLKKKIYRRTNKRKPNKQKTLKTNMHIGKYLGSEDVVKSYQQVNKRKLNNQTNLKTNMYMDTYLDSEDIIKSYQQANKRKLNNQTNLKTNMQIDTYVDGDVIKTYQQESIGKPKNGERDMYMNVLTYEQGNTDLYGDGRNIYTVLHPNGHDYTTKLPKTYTNKRKQTNGQTSNGRIKKRVRKVRTRKRALTRAPRAGLEPVLPVITNIVSLFDTLSD